jgi:hypothetical protein
MLPTFWIIEVRSTAAKSLAWVEAAFGLGSMYEAGTDITLAAWEALILAAMLNLSVMRETQREGWMKQSVLMPFHHLTSPDTSIYSPYCQ